jgi:hypothetical protein
MRRHLFVIVAAALGLAGPYPLAAAQGGEKFTARLSWVPISGADRANVTGKGSATAALAGNRLTIGGAFEGLAAPATAARLHFGLAKGVRGRAIADLTITAAASGTISGAVDLDQEQIQALRDGKLYIQVHSGKGVAPDGANLWGWFLK